MKTLFLVDPTVRKAEERETRCAAIRASSKSSPPSPQKSRASKRRNGSEEILRPADAAQRLQDRKVLFPAWLVVEVTRFP
jgi:hypothetical protein